MWVEILIVLAIVCSPALGIFPRISDRRSDRRFAKNVYAACSSKRDTLVSMGIASVNFGSGRTRRRRYQFVEVTSLRRRKLRKPVFGNDAVDVETALLGAASALRFSEMIEDLHLRSAPTRPRPTPLAKGWWTILGVDRGATAAQIRSAWRQKARIYHPDAGGSQKSMIELNAAKEEGLKAVSPSP